MHGGGEPHGILSEALQAREVARPLRQLFSSILRHSTESVEAGRKARYELRLALADVGGALKQAFQPHDSPKFTEAIEFDFLGLGFIPNPLKVLPWLKHRRMLNRVTVLTEFAKTLTDFEANQNDYSRFWRNATKAASPDSKSSFGRLH